MAQKASDKQDPLDAVKERLTAAPRTHSAGKRIGKQVVKALQPKKGGK